VFGELGGGRSGEDGAGNEQEQTENQPSV
jgi:hypothetical protein